MKLSHTLSRTSAVFDDPNLVSSAGLVPVLALADRAGLRQLADEHLSVPTDKGAHAGLKVASLVAGMVAGADSIDDMALLQHGGMGRVFARAYAPSTLGSFLRAFTFGHVRQLDAIASRFLLALARLTGCPHRSRPPAGATQREQAVRTRSLTWTTRSSRSTATPSRAPGSVHPGPRTERAPCEVDDDQLGAAGRGATATQGLVRLPARREAAGR